MNSLINYLNFLATSSLDTPSQSIPASEFSSVFHQRKYKKIKTESNSDFKITTESTKNNINQHEKSLPSNYKTSNTFELASFNKDLISKKIQDLFKDALNESEYLNILNSSSIVANILLSILSKVNQISDTSSILDSVFDSLRHIYKDITFQLVIIHSIQNYNNFDSPDSYNNLPINSPVIHNIIKSIKSDKNNSSSSQDPRSVFAILYRQIKCLFNTNRPRTWVLAGFLLEEISYWTVDLRQNLAENGYGNPFDYISQNFEYENRKSVYNTFYNLSNNSQQNTQNQIQSYFDNIPKDYFANNTEFAGPKSKPTPSNFSEVPKSVYTPTIVMYSDINEYIHNRMNKYGNNVCFMTELIISESPCRDIIKHTFYKLIAAAENDCLEISKRPLTLSAKSRNWSSCYSSFMRMFDIYLGAGKNWCYPSYVAHPSFAQDLDPGPALSEKGVLPTEMQIIIDISVARKRRFARIAFPPDTVWPMVSHASRAHTEKHIFDQISYVNLRDTLSRTELERGPSAEKYVSDLLFQRAAIDEIYASIRNHRMIKKKTIQELEKSVYKTTNQLESSRDSNEGTSREISNNQGQYVSSTRELEQIEDSQLLLNILVKKVENLIRAIQLARDFSKCKELENTDQSIVSLPKEQRFWEVVNEIADQLFFFVQAKAVSYWDLHKRFYALVFPDSQELSTVPKLEKDNTLIWLLLQLFHIENVNSEIIAKDFSGEENILCDFLNLYNENQILSKDAFYLRDLSLQSSLSHQQLNIKDRSGLKFRHPKIRIAMPFTQSFYMFQTQFGINYKKNVIDGSYTLFQNLSLEESIKIATISQARQYVVPNTIYSYLVPYKYSPQSLQHPTTKFLNGGIVSYTVLDYINVSSKHRLLQLIYKMMLSHEQGPQFQFQFGPKENEINCVSPYTLDVVFKLLYNAPYTNELMMKEILEKLRRCDAAMAMGNAHFSDTTMRWLYTVYQLMNCRLLRFFKYYAHAGHLVHHLRHSLVFSKHLQLYTTIECFALCLIKLQHDTEFLNALLNPDYHGIPLTSHPQSLPPVDPDHIKQYLRPKHSWFHCTLLYRAATMVISRIVTIRGLGDVPRLSLNECLDSLSDRPSRWAPCVLMYMAPQVREFFIWKKDDTFILPDAEFINNLIEDPRFNSVLTEKTKNEGEIKTVIEQLKTQFSADGESQALFMCMIWTLEFNRHANGQKISTNFVSIVRQVLLGFPQSLITEHVAFFIDFIVRQIEINTIDPHSSKPNSESEKFEGYFNSVKNVLELFVWTFMFVKNEHVLYAIIRGDSDMRDNPIRVRLVRYLLMESPGFQERLSEWKRLDFSGRYWTEDDYFAKHKTFLSKYPEYFEYEAYLVSQGEKVIPPTQIKLPIFYENVMVRLVPVLEYSIDRLIESEQSVLLVELLDHLGPLFRLDQVPLTSLYNILFLYFASPTLHNSVTIRSLILGLLDMTQHRFSKKFSSFVFLDFVTESQSAEYQENTENSLKLSDHDGLMNTSNSNVNSEMGVDSKESMEFHKPHTLEELKMDQDKTNGRHIIKTVSYKDEKSDFSLKEATDNTKDQMKNETFSGDNFSSLNTETPTTSFSLDLVNSKEYILSMLDRIGVVLTQNYDEIELLPSLPEVQYREIPNPVLLVLNECNVESITWWCLSQEKLPRLVSPLEGIDMSKSYDEVKRLLSEPIDLWQKKNSKKAEKWEFASLWLKIIMEIALIPENERKEHIFYKEAKCLSITYFHITGIFSNSIPLELMATPYIRFLTNVVLFNKDLLSMSKLRLMFESKLLMSNSIFPSLTHYSSDWFSNSSKPEDLFKSSDIFENYLHNLRDGTQNLPNAYSTLLHSILHYGGIRTFITLSETIKLLSKGTPYIMENYGISPNFGKEDQEYMNEPSEVEGDLNTDIHRITTDIQLLYLCSTVAPILYRLKPHKELFSDIIESLFSMFVDLSGRLSDFSEKNLTTHAVEIIIDFFYFAKNKFLPKLEVWRNLSKYLTQMPIRMRNRLRILVFD
ncbi:hypothetical protein BB558_003394 [Smittium angustum]|uniref:Mediator of RNA polymerase II transcription subunit 23 n=1 Tax=Smittium angustum TaxID=133377 RepID=A0A2U1J657_SMIAN|nr:hypothetical protein BB558_003394 [Smittium angustum]